MQKKKVLIISPLPTHPCNAGNRSRIYQLSRILKDIGLEVYFLFTGQEQGDTAALNDFWKDRIYYFNSSPNRPSVFRLLKYFLYSLKHPGDAHRYNVFVDDWYDTNLDRFIGGLQRSMKFDIVIAEYIFMSKALLNFGPGTLKLLDTHDVFTDRYKLYRRNDQAPQWFSTYPEEEAKALRRADVILAIQDREQAFFEKIARTKVVRVGHVIPFHAVPKKNFEKKLVYVASYNPINRYGISFFIDNVFKRLTEKYNDMRLILAGTICSVMHIQQDNILLWGTFDDPQQVYAAADIIINPARFGTGLNIKTIEALSCGKPLVATSGATQGIEGGRGYLVADTADEFVAAVSCLIEDEGMRRRLAAEAEAFITDYNQKSIAQLAALVNPAAAGN
jgi:glycosyltransferase involved in cell wall biosynthesis